MRFQRLPNGSKPTPRRNQNVSRGWSSLGMVAADSEAKSTHAEKFVLPASAPVMSAGVMKSKFD